MKVHKSEYINDLVHVKAKTQQLLGLISYYHVTINKY